MASKKFIVCFVAIFMVLFALQGALNYVVDPYQAIDIDLSHRRFRAMEFGRRVSVPFQSNLVDSDGLIVGSSRSLSIDPWGEAVGDVHSWSNLWINLANIHEVRRVLQQALAFGGVRTVILGLDFEGFNASNVRNSWLDNIYYSLDDDGKYNPGFILGVLSLFWSLDSTRASLRCVWESILSAGVLDVLSLKKANAGTPTKESESTPAKVGGSSPAKESESKPAGAEASPGGSVGMASDACFKSVVAEACGVNRRILSSFAFEDGTRDVSSFNDLRKILQACYDKGVRFYLFVNPEHVTTLESYRKIGLWEAYKTWLRKIVEIVAEFNKTHKGADFKLWCFAGYNTVTVSALDDKCERNAYLSDLYHFSPLVGKMILSKMTGRTLAIGAVPEDFGVDLNPRNIEAFLDYQDANRDTAGN